MAEIVLLAPDPEDRERLSGLVGGLGHAAHAAARLEEAVEFGGERRARAFVAVDGEGCDGELATRELLRAFPLAGVLVALKVRDASRAVALMRCGAAEVVAPPWTPEDFKASLSKTLRWQTTELTASRLPPPRRSGAYFLLAAGLFLAAGLGAASWRRAERAARERAARTDRWELPVSHPSGLAFDGESLWVVDWYTQSLYAYGTDGAPRLGLRHLTAETPVSAAFVSGAAWTVSADGTVARRMRDEKLTPLERWPGAAPNPAGLAFDGLYLWTLDAQAKRLVKRLADPALTPVASYPCEGLAPAGLAYALGSLWTLDAGGRVLRRHSLERPDEVLEVRELPEYSSGLHRPAGLAHDGRRFWTVAQPRSGKGPAVLLRHPERGGGA